jgi:hypothetical protein
MKRAEKAATQKRPEQRPRRRQQRTVFQWLATINLSYHDSITFLEFLILQYHFYGPATQKRPEQRPRRRQQRTVFQWLATINLSYQGLS